MALRFASANAIAFRDFAYTGGPLALPFFFRRIGGATTARTILSLLDMDDADPDNSADPRVAVRTVAGNLISGLYFGNGASTADTSVATYDPADWDHVGLQLDGGPGEISLAEIFINGVGTGSPGTGARSMTLNGLIDRLQFGVNSTSHSNCEIAHFAPFAARLTNEQWLALLTTLPTAIGVAPLFYESFIGSAGSFTLSGATINSENDGTLPTLNAGGLTGNVQLDSAAPTGLINSNPPATLSGTVEAGDAVASGSISTGGAPGTVLITGWKNLSGMALPSTPVARLTLQRLSDGIQVLNLAGLTTSSDAVNPSIAITNAALAAGVDYLAIANNADGSMLGVELVRAT